MIQEDWTSRLRDRMADHQEAAPEGLWEEIAAALPEKPVGKARIIRLRRWASAAAVVAFLAVGGGYYIYNKVEGNRQPMDSPLVETARETTAPMPAVVVSDPQKDIRPSHSVPVLMAKAEVATATTHDDDPINVNESLREKEEVSEPTNRSDERMERRKPADNVRRSNGYPASISYEQRREGSSSPRISATLYAQNSMAGGYDQSNPVLMSNAMLSNYSAASYQNDVSSAKETGPVYLYDYEEITEHHQPVSYGFSLSYALNDRLSVQTGVNYTRLTSDFIQKMGRNVVASKQTLHYLGIPIRAAYRAWSRKGVTVYGVAGGEADVNVKAKYVTEGTEVEMKKDRIQLSADAAVGVSYHFLPKLSLYAEPGFKYYFDNGSGVENRFKEKPASFNLQVGIRLDIK